MTSKHAASAWHELFPDVSIKSASQYASKSKCVLDHSERNNRFYGENGSDDVHGVIK